MKTFPGGVLSSLFVSALAVVATGCTDTSGTTGVKTGNRSPAFAEFTYAPKPALTNGATTLTWAVLDPDGDPLTCSLDFGDGTRSVSVPDCTSTTALTHAYAADATYGATILARDASGASASASAEIAVLFDYSGTWGAVYTAGITIPAFEMTIPVDTEGSVDMPLDFGISEITSAGVVGTVTQNGITATFDADVHVLTVQTHCTADWTGTRTGDTVEGPVTTASGGVCTLLEGTLTLTKH